MFRSFVGPNCLAVIRDVEDPEPLIEADFPITGIEANKMDSPGLERLWAIRHTHTIHRKNIPDALRTSAVFERSVHVSNPFY